MADDELMALLREMRDLQKQHVENYRDALRNQESSIALQKAATRRQRWGLIVVVLALFALFAFLAFSYFHP